MQSRLIAAAVLSFVAAACGGPVKAPPPVQATPAQVQPRPGEPPPSPAGPSVALVAPDVPSGADAARDAELARAVAGVIDAVVNSDPVFTRDGKRIVFSSNRDGLPQLYLGEIARPAAPPLRLVRSTERQLSPVMTPDGKALVFRSDHGANENFSYFRVNLDGSGLVELTPGATLHRDSPRIADGKPDAIFYSARTVSYAGVGMYRASATAPGAETLIYRDGKPGSLVDVSRDGRWGLFWRYPSHSENYLLAVDLESGATHQVYPQRQPRGHDLRRAVLGRWQARPDRHRRRCRASAGALDRPRDRPRDRAPRRDPAGDGRDPGDLRSRVERRRRGDARRGRPRRSPRARCDHACAQGDGDASAGQRNRRRVLPGRSAVRADVVDAERPHRHPCHRHRDREGRSVAQGGSTACRRSSCPSPRSRRSITSRFQSTCSCLPVAMTRSSR